MSLNKVRLYQSFKFWRAQASSEKHPMRAPESTPWLSKARSKSTPAFRFTKHKKLAYAFHKSEHPFKEHYQTRPQFRSLESSQFIMEGKAFLECVWLAVKMVERFFIDELHVQNQIWSSSMEYLLHFTHKPNIPLTLIFFIYKT